MAGTRPEYQGQLVQLYIAERKFDDAERELRAIAAANPSDSKAGLDVVRFLASFRSANAAKDELTAAFYKGDRSMRESGFDPSNRFGPFGADTRLVLVAVRTAE